MFTNNFLYNINGILVKPGLEREYIEFSERLDQYLKDRYGHFYIGLELSMDKMITNQFTVVAFYRNVRGVYESQAEIQADIARIYDKVWGDKAQRTSIFSFVNAKTVIDVHANLHEC